MANALRDAISKKGTLVGTLISVSSPATAEALSISGLDWLFFDLEHSVMTLAEVQSMIQAMRGDCLSMIRLEEPSAVYVKKALDTGCSAIIVPQVNSVAIARAMVQAGKYAPLGSRSVGLGRALGYGATLSDGIAKENSRTSLIVQIEHADAVEDIEAIAALEGVDALFIGPYDLSSSLGVTGDISNPAVQAAIDRTLSAGTRVGKPVGLFVGAKDAALKAFDKGFKFVAVSSDLLQLIAAMKILTQKDDFREAAE